MEVTFTINSEFAARCILSPFLVMNILSNHSFYLGCILFQYEYENCTERKTARYSIVLITIVLCQSILLEKCV